MRIWTVHPKYLDAKGLLAVWRETLLAQKVLQGLTKGYRNHPQLERFKLQIDPVSAIGRYLMGIFREAENRRYLFDESKIVNRRFEKKIPVTRGQVLFEWTHLKRKVKERDHKIYLSIRSVKFPEVHPLFKVVAGKKEKWEKG